MQNALCDSNETPKLNTWNILAALALLPLCTVSISVGYFIAWSNTALLSHSSTDPELRDKKTFSTIIRVKPSFTKLGKSAFRFQCTRLKSAATERAHIKAQSRKGAAGSNRELQFKRANGSKGSYCRIRPAGTCFIVTVRNLAVM